jgi:hypothetical protein
MKKFLSVGLVSLFVLVGLAIANSASAAVSGPRNAGTGADVAGIGTVTWGNPGRITIDDTSYSTSSLTNLNKTSKYLQSSNYGFSIPAGATIDGIQVSVMRKSSSNSGGKSINDNVISLVKDGIIVGDNKATVTNWPTTIAATNYGSANDLWGTTWTSDDINSVNFGVALSAFNQSTGNRTASVDYIQITVTYTPDITAPTIVIDESYNHAPTNQDITVNATTTDGSPLNAVSYTFTTNGSFDFVATDIAGNISTTTVSIANIDKVNPIVSAGSDKIASSTFAQDATATDVDSGIASYSWIKVSGPGVITFDPTDVEDTNISADTEGIYIAKLTVQDVAGNTASSTFSFTWDITPPVLTVPPTQTFEATGPATAPALELATATDNLDASPVVDYSPKAGEGTYTLGTTPITWTATDAAGNVSTGSSDVIIVDTTSPTITLNGNNPFDMYINNDYADLNPDPDYSATDLVDGDITGTEKVVVTGKDFDNTVLGAHNITYTATDANGNSTTTTRTVNIVDRNKPIIYRTGSSPITVEGGSVYTDAGATAIDRDGSDITSSIINSGWDMNTMVLGLYEIYYDVTGAELGDLTGTNIADQAKRVVNVVDTTAPALTLNGDNPTHLKVNDVYSEQGAIATDIVDGDRSGSIVITGDVDTGVAATYPVTYTVDDLSGNSTSTIRNVIVRELGTDATLSALSVSTGTLSPEFNSETLAYTVTLPYGSTSTPSTLFTTTDSFANAIKTDATDITSTTVSDRTTTITVTAEVGEISMKTYTIRFDVSTDTTAPVITLTGSSVVDLTVGETYTDAGATATDNIDGDITESIVRVNPVNTEVADTYTVTYNVSDAAGNPATEVTRTVNVNARHTSSGGSSSSRSSNTSTNDSTTSTVNGTSTEDILIQTIALLSSLENPQPQIEVIEGGDINPNPELLNPAGDEPVITNPLADNTLDVSTTDATTGSTTASTSDEISLAAAAALAGDGSDTNWTMLLSLLGLIVVGGGIFFFYKNTVV